MNVLSPFEAQEQYPDAWRYIEDEMEQARDGYAADVPPLSVAERIRVRDYCNCFA